MRHRKGQISISEARDIPILLLVRDARAIRSRQLYENLLLTGLEGNRRTVCWRLSRLIHCGLIAPLRRLDFIGETVYAITRTGLALLESHGHCLLSLGSNSRTIVHEAEAIHMIELNSIRLALLRSGFLRSWKGELEVLSQNLALYGEGAKDYDAVVTVSIAGESRRFALEYERTAKSTARYQEIRQSIELDHQVDLILYLTPSQELMYLLSQQFKGVSKRIVFGIANQFKLGLLESQVFDPESGKAYRPFQDVLTDTSSENRQRASAVA